MDHLLVCPICAGERMRDFTHSDAHEIFEREMKKLLDEKNRGNRNQTT